ncbi:unnamed protein product [Pedinophyceae sp. YPF-701]|nr:unnamed protein product [Pedinophyceae sp. YPF-701]
MATYTTTFAYALKHCRNAVRGRLHGHGGGLRTEGEAPQGSGGAFPSASAVERSDFLRLMRWRAESWDPWRARDRVREAVAAMGPELSGLRASLRALRADVRNDVRRRKENVKEKISARLRRRRPTYAVGMPLSELTNASPVLRALGIGALGLLSRAWMTLLNTTRVYGRENIEAALHRDQRRALITVSNHAAALDDPLVTAAVLPLDKLLRADDVRWTLCATDRCFKTSLMARMFRAVKVLPVERGVGLHQPGMEAAQKLLADGEWVHIFPEGTRQPRGRIGPIRAGVGKLAVSCMQARAGDGTDGAAAALPPLLVPIAHRGMDEVMPRGSVAPRVGRDVTVVVGAPVDMSDLAAALSAGTLTADDVQAEVARRVGRSLAQLNAALDADEAGDVLALPAAAAARGVGAGDEAAPAGRGGGERVELDFGTDFFAPLEGARGVGEGPLRRWWGVLRREVTKPVAPWGAFAA